MKSVCVCVCVCVGGGGGENTATSYMYTIWKVWPTSYELFSLLSLSFPLFFLSSVFYEFGEPHFNCACGT